MTLLISLFTGLVIGAVAELFGLPPVSPPTLIGVLAIGGMTVGYQAMARWM